MVGLGVQGDAPPDAIQPPLRDGIHLRWAFQRDLGFPWYGFYLFRRPSRRREEICLARATAGFKAGAWGAPTFAPLMGHSLTIPIWF
jgi:hypothetical protein